MRMVVTHLTRMKWPRICVAGVDVEEPHAHVRPVCDGGWTRDDLAAAGGVFDMGRVVELRALPDGRAPEVEDHRCLEPPRAVGRITDRDLWELLASLARGCLTDLFGPVVQTRPSGSAFVPERCGSASLGVLAASHVEPVISGDHVRVQLRDPDVGELDLPVTDLRLFPDGCLHTKRARHVCRRLAMGHQVLLCVGLTRHFQPDGFPAAAHWVQINNIHFSDRFEDHPTLH